MSNTEDQLRYPIGKFVPQESYSPAQVKTNIDRIETLLQKIDPIFKTLQATHLDTTYRDGGWTARQVLHHMADSHMNAYIRFKWTLTENTPLIKAYDEKQWAETPETKLDPIVSIELLRALHIKWVAMLRLLKPEDLNKEFLHPETKKLVRLDRLIALYAWHGEHHLGHLQIIARK